MATGTHADVAETGGPEQPGELVRVAKRERRRELVTADLHSQRRKMGLLGVDQRRVQRMGLKALPHCDHGDTVVVQHTTHLGDPGGSVREELQSLLAVDGVELACREPQRCPVAHAVRDAETRIGDRDRYLDHHRVDVDTDCAPGLADGSGEPTREDAGAAGHVEHAVPCRRRPHS
jgi:hypothetical protein